MHKGIQRFDNDEAAFLRVLHSFAVNTRPLLEVIRQVDEDSLADYAIRIHGIRGSCQGICADALAAGANALERAAREGDYGFVRDNNAAFIEAAWLLVADIEDMLGQKTKPDHKPKKDKPDRMALKKLLAACRSHDLDEVDTIMAELESYAYESGGALVAWLRQCVDRMHIARIVEKLSAQAEKGE
jgi:hypothetical protein